MKHFFISLLLVFTLSSSAQQWFQMNDSLLRGGFLVSNSHQAIFVNDSVTILCSQFGTYRSEDNGQEWMSSDNGIEFKIGPVAIANLNDNPYLLVDYTSVYISSDNGRNWILTPLTGVPSSTSLDILFSESNVLYLGESGNRYKSTDGINWTLCNTLFPIGSDSLSWNPSTGELENGLGATKLIPDLAGSIPSFNSLAMAPHGNNLYCFTGTEIYTYDITTTATVWTLASSFPLSIPSYTGFGPTYPYTFAVTDSSLFLTIVTESSTGSRITSMFRSTDKAQTWVQITNGLEVPVIIGMKELAPNTIMMNDIVGNLLFSSNNGSSWTKRDSHFISHYQQNLIVMDSSLLLKQIKNMGHRSVAGILKSDDNGATWHHSNNGLPLLPDFEYDSSKVYGNFDFLFKSGNVAFCGRQPSYLARSYDEGDTWSSVALPPDGDIVLWYMGDENTFFVIEDSSGTYKYFRTNDEGTTWQAVSSIGLLNPYPPMQILGVSDTLLMLKEGGSSIPGVPRYSMYRSFDNGTNWTDISGGFLTSNRQLDTENGGGYYLPILDFDSIADKFMIVLTTHDTTSNTTYYTSPTSDSLYYFDGTNWANLNAAGLPVGINIHALTFDNGAWNIATDSGMYVSTDGGLNWSSGISAFAPNAGESRSLTDDGFNENVRIVTLNIRNTNAFVSSSVSGCWTNSDVTGIMERENNESDLLVYPNPSSGIFNILSKKNLTKCTLEIFDVTGKLLQSKFYSNYMKESVIELDMTELVSGMYFIRLKSLEGISQERVVISR